MKTILLLTVWKLESLLKLAQKIENGSLFEVSWDEQQTGWAQTLSGSRCFFIQSLEGNTREQYGHSQLVRCSVKAILIEIESCDRVLRK